MSQKRDYYEVLGISRDAGEDDVRRAYKKRAVEFHPDRNPDNPEAEAKFKEATEAFSVLSDSEKRGLYDRFGHQGLEGRGGFDFGSAGIGDIFSHFQDVFSDFFGGIGGFGGAGQRRRGPARGRDIRVDATITLKEALTGCKKEVHPRGIAPCEDCDGSGAAEGSQPTSCRHCNGTGQMTTQRGFIMFSSPCAACGGSGEFIENPCPSCSGRGAVEKGRTVLVTFPAGIDAGQRLRVPGQGMPGPRGAPQGDLYVDVDLEPHERFERHDSDLATKQRVLFTDAALGTEVTLTLPDDSEVTVEIAPGTQPGAVITMRGRGAPLINRKGRGDLHVVVDVEVPRKLSKRAKKLLRDLERELDAGGQKRAEAG